MPARLLPGDRPVTMSKISTAIAIVIFLLLPASKGLAQEVSPPSITTQTSTTEEIPADGLFFADVVVRGQPAENRKNSPNYELRLLSLISSSCNWASNSTAAALSTGREKKYP
jgi:hypothetical protein